jgi:transposase
MAAFKDDVVPVASALTGEQAVAKRLLKRLRRHQRDLFTFVDHDNIPCDNNHAERTIRPAVIIRKNSYGNRGRHGADCQSLLMSLVQTRKQRGHEPIQTICQFIATYLKTGQLPPLPRKAGSDG